MNDGLPERVASALGIEPYLERVFVFGDLPIARVLVLAGGAMWAFVLVTFLLTTLYRFVLPRFASDQERRIARIKRSSLPAIGSTHKTRRLRRAARDLHRCDVLASVWPSVRPARAHLGSAVLLQRCTTRFTDR